MAETFTETLRRIDDAGLDAYQRSMMLHIWRVGQSWESIRMLADKCGMSRSQAHRTRQWLLDEGWLEYVELKNGRVAVQVAEKFGRPSQGQLVPPRDEHNESVFPRDKPSLTGTTCPSQGRVLKKDLINEPHKGVDPAPASSNGKIRYRDRELVEMVNAIVEVTALDGVLNWDPTSDLAAELVEGGYRPVDVLSHYGRESPGDDTWWWYTHDWRGRKEPDVYPNLKGIRETIGGARRFRPVAKAERDPLEDLPTAEELGL